MGGYIGNSVVGVEHPSKSALNATTGTFTGAFTSLGIDDNADATAITINSSENVGIGTSTVDSALHIEQNASGVTETSGSTLKIHNTNASGRSKISLHNNAETASGSIYYDTDSGMLALQGDTGAGVVIQTSGNNERLRVDTSGNVGIGEESPSDYYNSPLVVKVPDEGGITIAVADTYAHQAYLYFADDDSGAARYAGYLAYDHQIDTMRFGTSGTERMRISADGEITKPLQPAFQAIPSSDQTNIAVDSNVDVVFGTEQFDVGSNFSSNTFTAPVTGKYQLSVSIRLENVDSASGYYLINILTSNKTYQNIFDPDFGQDAAFWMMTMTHLCDMDANDTAKITITQNGGTQQTDIATESVFSGALIC